MSCTASVHVNNLLYGLGSILTDEAVDLFLEREGIELGFLGDSPEHDEICERLERARCEFEDIRDVVTRAVEPLFQKTNFLPFSAAEQELYRRYTSDWLYVKNGLYNYGALNGLDMLEDALNSGVPLEDIVA